MTNTELLNEYIDKSGLKRSFIYEKLGLSTQGFLNKANNKHDFTTTEVKILCELLHIDSLSEKEKVFFN